ncbi:Conserved oligomeric Golgi complex subunit [Phlyctochytrium planicorne]|nr:Conserved oligomeric Golgi complex subunit [Phlyctochytrium planicorne]
MLAFSPNGREKTEEYSRNGEPRRPSMTASIKAMLQTADFRDYGAEDFDASEYANMIIQAPHTQHSQNFPKTDITAAISKLSINIEILNKQLHDQVTTHYEDLLQQVTGLARLEQAVFRVKDGVQSLNNSFDRVKTKIEENHEQFRSNASQLTRVQDAADALRRIRRFLYLVRRLEVQSPLDSRELSKAALSLCEIDEILAESDLKGITVVEAELNKVQNTKSTVVVQSEKLIHDGLRTQTQPDVASGLQVFQNLNQMPSKTKEILDRILENLIVEIRKALDATILGREVQEFGGGGDKAKPTTIYATGLWKRLEAFIDLLHEETVKVFETMLFSVTFKVYLLERVLARMKDPQSQVTFLDMVTKVLESSVVHYYWKNLSHAFEKELKSATKASSFLMQIFQVGYPKLLRFFHDFFSRLTLYVKSHTTKETANTNSKDKPNAAPGSKQSTTSPDQWILIGDAMALLKPLRPFETAYLQDVYARLVEPVNNAFPDKPVVGARPMPSRDDVDKVLRTISRELDIAKFDEILLKAVVKRVTQTINMYAIRTEHTAATDLSAYQVSGVGTASSSQLLNLEVVNCIWSLVDGIFQIGNEFINVPHVTTAIMESISGLQKVIQGIIEPLFIHIAREIESTILKIHKEDYGRSQKNASTPQRGSAPSDPSSSNFVLEVGMKLRWIARELIARIQCGDEVKGWVCQIGIRVLEFFLRHASLVRPVSESGKLKLTSDMTQLEFALNQWVGAVGLKLENAAGDAYKALRSFRQLLFLDLPQVTATHHTTGLPPAIVMHHIITRCHPTIPLPMASYNWTEAQYSEWLDSHSESETLGLLGRCLDFYAEDVRRKGEKEFKVEYPVLRSILAAALER